MRLHLLGLNHRSTPVEVREKVAFDAADVQRAGDALAAAGAGERVILSTCNRAEIYATWPGSVEEGREAAERFLAEFHDVDPALLRKHAYHEVGTGAVAHLLRVAASLDSQVIGESEILRQVRQAHETAREAGWTGPLFNR
jgi:glutamyl-tRNA reductase